MRSFTKALGHALSRPTIFPVPRCALRFALGEMADEALLASQRVQPQRLLASGYPFRFTELGEALAGDSGQEAGLDLLPLSPIVEALTRSATLKTCLGNGKELPSSRIESTCRTPGRNASLSA